MDAFVYRLSKPQGDSNGVPIPGVTPTFSTSDTLVLRTTDDSGITGRLTGSAWVRAIVDGKAYPSTSAGFFKTGDKPVLSLATRQGHRLRLTADHPVRRVTRRTRVISGISSDSRSVDRW